MAQLVLVDLEQFLGEFAESLKSLLPPTIALQIHAGRSASLIQADRYALGQILVNLATNARRAMHSGGTLHLDVQGGRPAAGPFINEEAPAEPGTYVCLTASDTGLGMDEVTRRRLFERMVSGDSSARGGDSGLVLVYRLVKEHRGHMKIVSQFGFGTTVRLFFPSAPHRKVGPNQGAEI